MTEYGEVQERLQGRVLLLNYYGSITSSSINRLAQRLEHVITALAASGPWQVCSDLLDYQGHTPGAAKQASLLRQRFIDNHLSSEAFICGNSGLKESIVEYFLSTQPVQLPSANFTTEGLALQWLDCFAKPAKSIARP